MSSDFSNWLGGTRLADCWTFWRSRRQGHAIPLKLAMDPVDMPRSVLPSLFIYERTPQERFRCRLFGTELCATFREDATGKYLDEMLPPNAQARRIGVFSSVLDERRPAVYVGRTVQPERDWLHFRRLLLPVSSDGVAADTLLGMVVFTPSRGTAADFDAPDSIEAIAFATDADLE